jgi:hypothetical protein
MKTFLNREGQGGDEMIKMGDGNPHLGVFIQDSVKGLLLLPARLKALPATKDLGSDSPGMDFNRLHGEGIFRGEIPGIAS